MLLLATAATGLYLLLAAAAAVVVARMPPTPEVADGDLPMVSVIVAARDEEDALPACLDALAAQDYPAERIELVVADDHSTDATAAVVRHRARRDERFRLVSVADAEAAELDGKAGALHAGILQAAGSIILVTDADCRPSPSWARHLAARLVAEPDAGMVCGVTTVERGGVRSALQQLDWLLLLGTSSAAAGVGLPLTAMGNNMAIRGTAYDAVGGYPALPFSVTEDYQLFQAVHRRTPFSVHLLARPELHVITDPLDTLREAFVQRRRWARGGLRAPAWVYGFYGAVFATHALLAATLLLSPVASLPLLAAKSLGDAAIVRTTARQTGTTVRWLLLPLYELALNAYVLAMPIALALAPRIRWKKRVH